MSHEGSLRDLGPGARTAESGMTSHRSGESPTWNDERIAQLRVLWEQGLSASSIGRVLGVTKNAVVGKAHRLKLSSRPSPIRKSSKPPVRRATALARPTLPSTPMVDLSGDASPAPVVGSGPVIGRQEPKVETPAVTAEATKVEPVKVQPAQAEQAKPALGPSLSTQEAMVQLGLAPKRVRRSPGRVATCCWPVGDPGESDFHFCGADTLPGKSYCADHCAKAYVTKSRADSEAA